MYSYYSYIINTIFFTTFFAPAVPLGLVFSIIGLSMTYCITKYIFLRRLCIPKKLGLKLSIETTKLMEFIPLIYGISNYCFDNIANKNNKNVTKFIIIFGILYVSLPIDYIN